MQIQTARLLLREFSENDLERLTEMYRREDFRRYEGAPMTREEVFEKLLLKIKDAAAEPRQRYCMAVTLIPSGLLIGEVSACLNQESIAEWEVGWSVHPDAWGRGYATEGARAMLGLIFNRLGGHRAIAFCHAGNIASFRVMEKAGMQREGCIRETRRINGVWYDELVYGMLEREYREIYGADRGGEIRSPGASR